MSKGTRSPRAERGSTKKPTTSASAAMGVCNTKIHRQPKASTSGPPMTTPSTGAPAPTSDQ